MPLNPTRQPEPIGVKRVRSVWPEKRLWLRPHISLVSSYIVRDAARAGPMLTRCVASARTTLATPLTFHPTEWGEMCQRVALAEVTHLISVKLYRPNQPDANEMCGLG